MQQEYKGIFFFFIINMDEVRRIMHNHRQLEYYYRYKKQLSYYYDHKEKVLNYMKEYRLRKKGNANTNNKKPLKFGITHGNFIVDFD